MTEQLPSGLFRIADQDPDRRIAWRVAPRPFLISPATLARIETLGDDLLAFYRAINSFYTRSARGTIPAFLAEELDRGKPEYIIRLARQNRFRSDLPGVIRPDLILTPDGFIASELDSVPGGMGFVGAMAQTYAGLGYEPVGGRDGMANGFAGMVQKASGKDFPCVALVVSEESSDYREEMIWLAERVRGLGLADSYVVAPQEVVFTEEALFLRTGDGCEKRIDVLYRNFELFDLLNIPKQELMLYAARHRRVTMTPPPKAQLEEKLAFALLHNSTLASLWRNELGEPLYLRLLSLFPQTWVLDPRPLPPQAAIVGLGVGTQPVSEWSQLVALGKGERDYVVKPSGFSPTAWGSRGVRIANDLTREDWQRALAEGLAAFETTPHILQRFHKGRRVRLEFQDPVTAVMRTMESRVRLTPYYFVVGDKTRLGGILATCAPADKRLIHGMSDAIMAPCAVSDAGE